MKNQEMTTKKKNFVSYDLADSGNVFFKLPENKQPQRKKYKIAQEALEYLKGFQTISIPKKEVEDIHSLLNSLLTSILNNNKPTYDSVLGHLILSLSTRPLTAWEIVQIFEEAPLNKIPRNHNGGLGYVWKAQKYLTGIDNLQVYQAPIRHQSTSYFNLPVLRLAYYTETPFNPQDFLDVCNNFLIPPSQYLTDIQRGIHRLKTILDGQEAYISHYKVSTSALRDFLNTKIDIEADLFVKDFFNPKTSAFLSKYLEEYEEEEEEEYGWD